MDKRQRNRLAILKLLSAGDRPLHSRQLAAMLEKAGLDLSERSIRLYLAEMDAEGLTESHGRRGRTITDRGREELRAAQTFERVGFLSAKIDHLTYAMTFDLASRRGEVVVNTSIVDPRHLYACLDGVCDVFAAGYALGHLVAVLGPGETIGQVTIPENKIGLCTVCSITLNGVLLKHGIPMASVFGGLLEFQEGRPTRFVEIIRYDGTSIDPLEVFIRAGLTNYRGAVRDGNGVVGAGFREVPEQSREAVENLAARLEVIGMRGFLQIGEPQSEVLGLHPTQGRIGCAVIGGLNPIAILEETGYRVHSYALAGLLDFGRLFHYQQLADALKPYLT
ncbi:NrpR regulatory domain-containing protein [Thermostilla marina]